MKQRLLQSFLLGCAVAGFLHAPRLHADSVPWVSVGPEGGDARSFAYDPANPQHIYLGTLNSWIYQSTDGGATWRKVLYKNADSGAIDLAIKTSVLTRHEFS